MRLYAFLLVAGAALCARAASIPVEQTEKILPNIVPDNLVPEITSSEQELIDEVNSIKDIENNLRAKPEVIPVKVIIENAQPTPETDDDQDEEINRPVPDLRNPGLPQRQEHETQNPEHNESEQQRVELLKQSINDAQNVLKKGFQGITDGIQHIVATNEPIQTLQQSIQSLRDGFTAQISKVNGTIQSYLNTESGSNDKPAAEQTKVGFHQIEQGLFNLRNDFNRGVSTLADGVNLVSYLKADSATVPVSPAPTNPVLPAQIITQVTHAVQTMQNAWNNFMDSMNKFTQGQSSAPPAIPAVQSDTPVTSAPIAASSTTNFIQNIQQQFSNFVNPGHAQNQGQPPSVFPGLFQQPQLGQFGSGSGPIIQTLTNLFGFSSTTNKPVEQVSQGAQPAPSEPAQLPSKPEEAAIKPEKVPENQAEPAKPVEPAQAAAVVPAGPIRQILQNNPITLGLAGAVQRLQNINNPEKPRDEQTEEQVKKLDEEKADNESKKGGGPNTGDNNDVSSSSGGVDQPEEVKEEIQKVAEVEKVPEPQEASEDEIKEHKTEEAVDKTE